MRKDIHGAKSQTQPQAEQERPRYRVLHTASQGHEPMGQQEGEQPPQPCLKQAKKREAEVVRRKADKEGRQQQREKGMRDSQTEGIPGKGGSGRKGKGPADTEQQPDDHDDQPGSGRDACY